jgi:hypothetical protein
VNAVLYMVVETFKDGRAAEVYARFRERGRMAPPSVAYVSSWVDLDFHRCFQVMESPNEEDLRAWIANWEDLVDFEVVPVRTSAEAAAVMNEGRQ